MAGEYRKDRHCSPCAASIRQDGYGVRLRSGAKFTGIWKRYKSTWLDARLAYYNHDRPHQDKMRCGRTLMQTLIDGKEAWRDKITALND